MDKCLAPPRIFIPSMEIRSKGVFSVVLVFLINKDGTDSVRFAVYSQLF